MTKIVFLLAIATLFAACKKDPDSPPANTLDQSKVITIDSLRAMQQSVSPGGISIDEGMMTFAIVTMDESSGNIYKNLYIQDHTGGIQVRLTSASDFAVGDSLRINLSGGYLSEYNGTIQLDSIDPDVDIIRQSQGHPITPTVKTADEITLEDEGLLIKVTDVQFIASDLNTTYADAINQASVNRTIEGCGSGANLLVRTSGFAEFAGDTVAQGKGSFTAIVGRFGSDLQLLIRDPQEINMSGTRCAGTILLKDFEDQDPTSGGWSSVVVVGTTNWTTNGQGHTSEYGQITNFNSGNTAAECWLISPSIDLSSSTTPSMSFLNAYNYSGDPLQLLVSTDYPGSGNPNSATWTDLSSMVNWSAGGWAWENSGSIDLSAFTVNGVRIALKYTGTNTSGSTWEIDDIKVNG